MFSKNSIFLSGLFSVWFTYLNVFLFYINPHWKHPFFVQEPFAFSYRKTPT